MDNRLAHFYSLTFANRLREIWYRCKLTLTGLSYTMKLLLLTYQNVSVLRHFRHCRAVEPLQHGQPPRFRSFTFYKETLRQSRQLFSPLRRQHRSTTEYLSRQSALPQVYAEQYAALHFNIADRAPAAQQSTRKRGRRRLRAAFWVRCPGLRRR